jgi:hypothetical protein
MGNHHNSNEEPEILEITVVVDHNKIIEVVGVLLVLIMVRFLQVERREYAGSWLCLIMILQLCHLILMLVKKNYLSRKVIILR